MKVIINKKKISLVLLSIFTVLLLVLLYFLIRGVPFIWGIDRIDKYESLMKICDKEKKDFNFLIKCDAFLESIEFNQEGITCLNLSVVVNNESINKMKVCEKSSIIDTRNETLNTEMKVPVFVTFSYNYKFPLSYQLKDISLEVMEDKSVREILNDLYSNGINIISVQTQESREIQQQGYYYSESKSIIENNDIGKITFPKTKVIEISTKGKEIILTLGIKINGQTRNIEIRTESLKYIKDESSLEILEINYTNISQINTQKMLGSIFVYIPENGTVTLEDVSDYCLGTEINFASICEEKENLEEFKLEKDIEQYILDESSSFDKLMLNYLVENE